MRSSLDVDPVSAVLSRLRAGTPERSIAPEVGRLLYTLVVASRPQIVVEFGALAGYSTIYLASALRDIGSGSLITTELDAENAAQAVRNLAEAGLDDLVELRVGDAMQTLASVEEPIGVVFLDGLNELYLPLLEVLEPGLTATAIVIADMSSQSRHGDYRQHVSDPTNGYFSIELPLDDGVVVSMR